MGIVIELPAAERERMQKLKTLAERGATKGERAAARAAMDRIMAKYGYRRKSSAQPPAGDVEMPPGFEDVDLDALEELDLDALANITNAIADLGRAIEQMFSGKRNA